jgi:hypothetical protein
VRPWASVDKSEFSDLTFPLSIPNMRDVKSCRASFIHKKVSVIHNPHSWVRPGGKGYRGIQQIIPRLDDDPRSVDIGLY